MNPAIYRDSDVWSSDLCLPILDQMLIRGSPSFALYFFLALLQNVQKEILSIRSAVELEEFILLLPWRTQLDQLDALIEQAVAMEKITPISVNRALVNIGAQCASELLPDALLGEEQLWSGRMNAFKKHMEIPDGNPLYQGMQRFAGLEQQLETYVLKEYGIPRILSRDIPYSTIPSMANRMSW